jgi:hypothetical protein
MEFHIMAIKKSDSSGIPFGNNAGRPANPGIGRLYSNGETQRLELYTAAGSWENVVQEVPGVSSISGNYSEATNSGVITIYGTNFVNGAYATAIGTNGVQINAASTVYNSLVQLTATFTGLSNAQEPYDIKVTNPSNLFGMIPDALYVNASPVWQTASGSLGTFNEQVSITLSALSATDSDSTVTYALASGSTLPSGVTLNSSTGVISGTLPDIATDTTYSFTINASDGLNTIPRVFSLSSLAQFQLQYLVIAGGGAGAQDSAGGGGAGGYRSSVIGEMSGGGASAESTFLTLPATSYTVVVGNGGTRPSGPGQNNGQNSQFASIVSLGGGSPGGSAGFQANGYSGGSGGGALNGTGGSGTSGQGYAGANSSTGGGGGGAGSAGSANNGGSGVSSSITGTAVTRAGGGGGTNGTGGSGGGGTNTGYQATSNNGVVNTGGGGSAHSGSWGGAGNGGSGIVILKYPDSRSLSYAGTLVAATTNPSVGFKATSFTAGSGTVTFS